MRKWMEIQKDWHTLHVMITMRLLNPLTMLMKMVMKSESESFSIQDISPRGVLGWLSGVKHRELGGCNRSINVSFNHDCKNRNPHHTICFPVVGACGRDISLPVSQM